MTPLEAAARAAYESTGLFKWEEVRDKGRVIAAMRAALIALAECDLPDELVDHAGKNSASKFPEGHFVGVREEYRIKLRAMLRSIASEGKDK